MLLLLWKRIKQRTQREKAIWYLISFHFNVHDAAYYSFLLFLLYSFYILPDDVCMNTYIRTQAESEYIIEYLPIPESTGLETSVLGLHFQLEPRHFRNGAMELKCTATIGNGYWVRRINIAEANINAQPSIPGHNRLLSGERNDFSFCHIFSRKEAK